VDLQRGINLGNYLEAVPDHPMPLPFEAAHLDEIARAGFDTVRLPVRWSAHTAPAEPYSIDPAFLDRVDHAVSAALDRGLNLVLDVHHYHELCEALGQQAPRFLAIWRQLARHYADRPRRLQLELLNEPRDPMTAEEWNELLAQALTVVRESNPDRTVLVGPVDFNGVAGLGGLKLPEDDNLVLTVHYYEPMRFTHQGAVWMDGTDDWLGTTWDESGRDAVRADLAAAAKWAAARGRPVFLGEFGSYHRADMASRARWTGRVRAEAERLGFGWAYWEFATDFGAYDLGRRAWHEPLRRALLLESV
jgi:endoglucanase